MSVRDAPNTTLAVLGTAIQTGHIRFGPRFIKEYQPMKELLEPLEILLGPRFSMSLYIGSVLLRRTYPFFLYRQPSP
jgi:hypothetical protein